MTATVTDEPIVGVPVEEHIPTTDEVPEPEGTVVLGNLALAPTQSRLTSDQKAALGAITNADPNLESTWPHLRVFLHTCQRMNLDPWRRQAYLIARGEGDKAKFTVQVGIDGYRTVAARTRLLRGAAAWLWTGQDDDPESWWFDRETGVQRRVWFDEWPESRGWPGAAKAVVEHYDAFGNVVTSEAVAHWAMYAPLFPKWEWGERRGQKVYITDADGKPVMELSEMWAKGPAHMLGKCAEALVLRKVFPDEMAGTVTFEEMARADMEERRREAAEAGRARKAFASGQRARTTPTQTAAAPASTGASTGPASDLGAAAASPASDEPEPQTGGLDEGTARRWLLAELNEQAEIMGAKVGALCKRQVAARRQNVEDFPLTALSSMVFGFRPLIAERLRTTGRVDEAIRYEALTAEPVEDLPAVLAGAEADEEPVVVGEVVEAVVADMAAGGEAPGEVDEPHPFRYNDNADNDECLAPGCGLLVDDPVHEGTG